MSNETHLDLDELIRIEDALEAIGIDHRFNLGRFVQYHKQAYQALAEDAYLKAARLITYHGTQRKALIFVKQQIQKEIS